MLEVILTLVCLLIVNPTLFASNIFTIAKNVTVLGKNADLTSLPDAWRNESTLTFGMENTGFGIDIISLINWTEGPLVLAVIDRYKALFEPVTIQRLRDHFQVLFSKLPTNVTLEKMTFVHIVEFYLTKYTNNLYTVIVQSYYLLKTEMGYQLEVFRPIIAVFTSTQTTIRRDVVMPNGQKGMVIEVRGVVVDPELAQKFADANYDNHVLVVKLPDENFSVTTDFEGGKEYISQVADRVGVIIEKNTQGKENTQEVCILDLENGRFYTKNLTNKDVVLPSISLTEFWGVIADCQTIGTATEA